MVEQLCSLTFISPEHSVCLDVVGARETDRCGCVVSGRKSSVETPAPGELVYFDQRVASRVYFRWSWRPHGSCRNSHSRGSVLWSISGEPQVFRVELTLKVHSEQ